MSTPAMAAFSLARWSSSGVRSSPVTRASRRRAVTATTPVPHPRPRTRRSARTPAKPTSRGAVVAVTSSNGVKVVQVCRWLALNCASSSISIPPLTFNLLLPDVHDCDDWPAAVRPLVHRPDRDEDGRIADRGRHPRADRRLGVAMVVHVGVVEHDLAPAAQGPAMVRLALDEQVDDVPAEVLGTRAGGHLEPCVPDGRVDPVEVEGVL